MIDKFMQYKYPIAMNIYGLRDEYIGNPSFFQDSYWVYLITVGLYQNHAKNINMNSSKTIKINSLSIDREEKMLIVLRKTIDSC